MAVNPAPESRVLCVARESFELGEPLSGAAGTRIEQAWRALVEMCQWAA